MIDPDIADLCEPEGSAIAAWPFWVYAPVGAVVLAARIVVLVLFACASFVLPPDWRRSPFRLLRRLLGIRVVRNLPVDDIVRLTDRSIVASNHISMLDTLLVLDLGCPTVLSGTALRGGGRASSRLFALAGRLSPARFVAVTDKRGIAALFRGWRDGRGGGGLYLAAEATIGSGRGLFRFNPVLLCRGFPVVPLALRVQTTLGLVAHPLMSGGSATLLRLMMLPMITFEMSFLPALEQEPAEEPQVFADRVQRAVADHLGIPATRYTVEDKCRYKAFRRAGGSI